MARGPEATEDRPGKVRPEQVPALVVGALDRLLRGGERFADLQMQRIADEAGIARSTLYLHYADKTSLLLAVADAATAQLFAGAEDWLAASVSDAQALHDALHTVVSQRRAYQAILAALDDATGYDARAAAYWHDRIGAFAERVSAHLQEAQRGGEVPAELDCDAAGQLITWGIERATAQHVRTRPAAEDARFAAGVARTVTFALSAHVR